MIQALVVESELGHSERIAWAMRNGWWLSRFFRRTSRGRGERMTVGSCTSDQGGAWRPTGDIERRLYEGPLSSKPTFQVQQITLVSSPRNHFGSAVAPAPDHVKALRPSAGSPRLPATFKCEDGSRISMTMP